MKNFLERVEQGIVDHPKRVVLSLLGVIIAIVCVNFALTYCAHEWQAATCSAPETCIKCGKTRERRLAHQWDAATCVSPATCSVCGAQKGEPIAHVWQEATCAAPKTCSACGQTEGEPLAHNVTKWEVVTASTCTQAGTQSGTCDVCKQTITEALPLAEHTPSDWLVTQAATPNVPGTMTMSCTVCGANINTSTYSLEGENLKQWYIDNCAAYSYEQVARNPDQYEGEYAKFRGKVIQVLESYGYYTLRVNITQGRYSWSDTIYVTYDAGTGTENRILENDIITMYGHMAGMYTYTSVLGASVTLPHFIAEYIDFA